MMYGSLCSALAFLVKMIESMDSAGSDGVMSSMSLGIKERMRSAIFEADMEILL